MKADPARLFGRTILLLVPVLALSACGLPREYSPDSDPRKPPREEKPAPAPTPERARAVLLPRSDEAWLVEMLIQRLELSTAIALLSATPADPALVQARLVAIVEEAGRAGLPRDAAQTVFAAQMAAASIEARDAKKRQPAIGGAYAAAMLPTLEAQREAVDSQIIATLLRLRNLPGGRMFKDYARKEFEQRGIDRRAARAALEPFSGETNTRKALPGA